MVEGDAGKVASPAEGERYGTDKRQTAVTAVLAPGKTFVAIDPHAISTMSSIRLPYNLIEFYLKI